MTRYVILRDGKTRATIIREWPAQGLYTVQTEAGDMLMVHRDKAEVYGG